MMRHASERLAPRDRERKRNVCETCDRISSNSSGVSEPRLTLSRSTSSFRGAGAPRPLDRRTSRCRSPRCVAKSPLESTVGSFALQTDSPGGVELGSRSPARVERVERLAGAPVSSKRTLRAEHVGLDRPRDVVEPRSDELEPLVVELLRLDEHLLAHADLPEVVQQARVFELAKILAREARAA
jgi:hypothetical protein